METKAFVKQADEQRDRRLRELAESLGVDRNDNTQDEAGPIAIFML